MFSNMNSFYCFINIWLWLTLTSIYIVRLLQILCNECRDTAVHCTEPLPAMPGMSRWGHDTPPADGGLLQCPLQCLQCCMMPWCNHLVCHRSGVRWLAWRLVRLWRGVCHPDSSGSRDCRLRRLDQDWRWCLPARPRPRTPAAGAGAASPPTHSSGRGCSAETSCWGGDRGHDWHLPEMTLGWGWDWRHCRHGGQCHHTQSRVRQCRAQWQWPARPRPPDTARPGTGPGEEGRRAGYQREAAILVCKM